MAELKSAPTPESKKATATQKQEVKSEVGELEYSDNRSSTAQLVSLQAAADDKGNRSNTAQLQSKASIFAGESRVAQLKTASDLSRPASSSAPVQLKAGVPVNNDPKLEKEADVMGAKAVQGKFMTTGAIANQSPGKASTQPFQFAGGLFSDHKSKEEKAWDKNILDKKGKNLDNAEKPAFNIGEGIDDYLGKLENYIGIFELLDFKDLKKEKQNKDNMLRLEKAGLALGTAALGLGLAAGVAAILGTGVGGLALLVAAIGVTVAKSGMKMATGDKKGLADPAGAATLESIGSTVAGAAEVVPGVGAGMIVLELGHQAYTVAQLQKNQKEATKVFNDLLTTVEKMETDIKTNVVPRAEAEHGEKIAQMMARMADLKAKIKEVDASAKAGFDQVIKSDTIEL
jgi:hypothetical protein